GRPPRPDPTEPPGGNVIGASHEHTEHRADVRARRVLLLRTVLTGRRRDPVVLQGPARHDRDRSAGRFGLPARLAGPVQPLAEDHLPGPAGYGIGGLAGDVTACPGTSGEGPRVHRTGSWLG